jgi:RNA polymerase sigma factor (sigma-70 family)
MAKEKKSTVMPLTSCLCCPNEAPNRFILLMNAIRGDVIIPSRKYLYLVKIEAQQKYKGVPYMLEKNDNDPLQAYFRELRKCPVIAHERVLWLCKTIEEHYQKVTLLLLHGKDCLSGYSGFEKIETGEGILSGDKDALIRSAMGFWEKTQTQYSPASDTWCTLEEMLTVVREAYDSIRSAKNEIIEGNLRFVVWMARKYQGRGLFLSDLIAEGNVGLMRAIDLYDYRRGYKFLTYAEWWIRQKITLAIENTGATIRLPVSFHATMRTCVVAEEQFVHEHGRAPRSDELAKKLDWETKRVNAVRRAMKTYTVSVPYSDEFGIEFDFAMEDKNTPDPFVAAEANETVRFIRNEIFPEISTESQRTLEVCLGIGGGEPHSLEESALILGVDPEYPYSAPSPDTVFRSEVKALVEVKRIVARKRGISHSSPTRQSACSFLPYARHGSPGQRESSPKQRVEEALRRLRQGDILVRGVVESLGFKEKSLHNLAVDGTNEEAFQKAWNAALALTAKRYQVSSDDILSCEWKRNDAARQGFVVVLHAVLGYALSRIAAILGSERVGYHVKKYWDDYCTGIREQPKAK